MALTFGPVVAEELDPLDALLGPALHFPVGMMREFISDVLQLEHMRVVRSNGTIVAGLGAFPLGQWFGGRCIPCAAVTAVGVAPEARGMGVGAFMLRENLAELRAQAIPLAALFPATLSYYRGAGYERAGQRIAYELPLGLIEIRGDSNVELVAFGPESYLEARQLYVARAQHATGNLERPEWLWKNKLEPRDKTPFRFFAMRNGQPEGYIIYTQAGRQDPISIVDVVVHTPAAGRRFLRLLAEYRSMVEMAVWVGGSLDPLVQLLAENLTAGSKQRVGIRSSYDWMLRIVDVAAALSARGYPQGLTAQFQLAITDSILPANTGHYILTLQDGQAVVAQGGNGAIQIGIRELAALYTGFYTPYELRAIGQIHGSDADLALLGAAFSGPRPWMPDIF